MTQQWPSYPRDPDYRGPDFRGPDFHDPQGSEPPSVPPPPSPAYAAPQSHSAPQGYNFPPPGHYAAQPPRRSPGRAITVGLVVGIIVLVLVALVGGLLVSRSMGSSVDPAPATTRPARPASGTIPAAPPGPPAEGAVKEQLDRQYGTFEPIRRTGTGPAVIELPPEARRGILWAKTDGGDWFNIKSEREDGTGGPVFYSGEATEGTVGYALRARERPPVRMIVETTDARWEIEVRPVSGAPTFTGEASGTGMAVLVVSNPAPQPVRLDYRGDANFIVVQRDEERNAHHANEIGSTTLEATLFGGVSVLEIEAWRDGQWGVRAI